MCLNANNFNSISNLVLYISLFSAFIYMLILVFKKIKKKKLLLNFILSIIIVLFINLLFNLIFKVCDIAKEDEIPNTTPTTTTTTTATTQNVSSEYIDKTPKGYTITYKDGAYYVDNYLIVNKTYKLSEDFVPLNPYMAIPKSGFSSTPLDKEAYEAWQTMKSDATSIGLNLWAQSGYRSCDYQNDLYNGYVNRNGKEKADKSSARAGNSEHQTGLAFDLNTITTSFKDTDEGKWVKDNCYLYGYILRYPENSSEETGYIFEPWHLRYVGKDLAKKLYNNGNWLTMENYFGLTSVYPD